MLSKKLTVSMTINFECKLVKSVHMIMAKLENVFGNIIVQGWINRRFFSYRFLFCLSFFLILFYTHSLHKSRLNSWGTIGQTFQAHFIFDVFSQVEVCMTSEKFFLLCGHLNLSFCRMRLLRKAGQPSLYCLWRKKVYFDW